MLAFVPSGALSAYAPTYNPYSPTDVFESDAFPDSYGYGLDERALYATHLQHQARELALSRRHQALQEEAERRQRAHSLLDAEALVWAASLRHKQEVLARRAYMEEQRRQAKTAQRKLLRRETERAEFVRRERERAEQARQYAALEDLKMRKRQLAETLWRARSEPVDDAPAARRQHERLLQRLRFSLDDLSHENLSNHRAARHASHSAHKQQPAVPEYTPMDHNEDHAHQFSFVDEFLRKHLHAVEDPEVRETAQSLLAHLSGFTPAPAPSRPRTASSVAQPVSASAEQPPVTQRAPVAESIRIPTEEPVAPSVAFATRSHAPQPNTLTLAPAAAEKLLSIYHTYRAHRSALSALSSINDTLDTLSASFVLPEHLDFTPSDMDSTSDASSDAGSEASSTLAYTTTNKPLRAHEHALAALLTRLDSVESNGDAKVRSERKRLVQKVEKALAEMDALVEEARKKQEADATATDDASSEGEVEAVTAPSDLNESSGFGATATTEASRVKGPEETVLSLEEATLFAPTDDAPMGYHVLSNKNFARSADVVTIDGFSALETAPHDEALTSSQKAARSSTHTSEVAQPHRG